MVLLSGSRCPTTTYAPPLFPRSPLDPQKPLPAVILPLKMLLRPENFTSAGTLRAIFAPARVALYRTGNKIPANRSRSRLALPHREQNPSKSFPLASRFTAPGAHRAIFAPAAVIQVPYHQYRHARPRPGISFFLSFRGPEYRENLIPPSVFRNLNSMHPVQRSLKGMVVLFTLLPEYGVNDKKCLTGPKPSFNFRKHLSLNDLPRAWAVARH